MNVLNNSNDDVVECPLCMEPLEVDDLNFYPCTCGYQICRFCWHRIRTDENELCPACRKAYPENPADFTPLSQEQISALKAEKRQRDQQRKQKITENRKHLANVRVVQKNLVFVVGLPPRLADPEILKRHEYFGKYGKIHKVVINPSTTYAGVQGPSASAYVTYLQNNDSLRAIQAVNNIMIDGRLIKTSLGTTKYCSHFMKNQQCPKPDCMYLHELGDPEASFTKEEMHQGKHQEYEKRLHDALIALTQQQSSSTTPPPPAVIGTSDSLGIGVVVVGSPSTNKITETTNSKTSPISNGNSNGPIQSKEAWPSLSTSPVNKENKINNKTNNSNSGGGGKENTIKNSENRKHEKTKNKDTKGNKNKQNQQNNSNHNSNSNSNKEQSNRQENILTEKNNKQNNNSLIINNITDDDSNSLPEFENDDLSNDDKADSPSLSSSTSSSSNNDDSGTVSESASGKSSPGTFHDNQNVIKSSLSSSSSSSTSSTSSSSHLQQVEQHNKTNLEKSAQFGTSDTSNTLFSGTTDIKNNSNIIDTSSRFSKLSLFDDNNSFFSTNTFQPYFKNEGTINSNPSHLPDLLNGTAESDETSLEREQRDAKLLLKGLSGFHHLNNDNSSEDWEAAFKYVMMRNSNNKQLEEQQHDEMLRVQELHKQRNLVNNLNGIPSQPHLQLNNFNGIDYTNSTDYLPDLNRLSQLQQQQQQQRLHNSIHSVQENGHIFPGNMSKFFDFHKNQQTQIMLNGHSNSPQQQISELNMANLLENSRLNSHYFDQSQANGMIGQQQQLQQQKQRILPNKYDQIGSHNLLMNNNNTTNQQQKRLQQPPAQHPHYMPIDDDLGFDPFIETQKALAELMENENIQQQTQINHNKLLDQSRPRMPPPGFNHMNAFGFGVPRAGSKILPFMNMNANTPSQPQQQQPQQNNWTQHINYQQQQNQSNDPHNHQSQNNQHKGFGSMSDWTTLDPAIVSYRQFPSFMSGPPMQSQQPPQQQQQHNAADMFMPQLNQQNQGFGGHHGINLQNSIMNQQQQNSPAQVNYHTNWLNTNLDQNNMYMNNLTNGFTNNFDKFTIPMPPGFQNNVGSKPQQKTECIN